MEKEKEKNVNDVLKIAGLGTGMLFIGVLTKISSFATIKLLKTPVLTARQGGVLF